MLLQALVKYYEILSEDEDSGIPMSGYSRVNVSYVVNLSKEGEILNIIPLKILDRKGKKYVPISMVLPEQEKKTVGIKSNFLCENSSYVFGIDNKGKPERAKECFESFKELHIKILKDIKCDDAIAMANYVSHWDIETTMEHPVLKNYIEDIITGANIIFQYEGNPNTYIHKNEMIKVAWENHKNEIGSNIVRQCLVTGKRRGIARLHPSVKGIRGGQAMGNSLVSFNAQAYESYGNDKSQGLNAPVSEYATFAYTTVLNNLLNDNAHKLTLGDTTVVFWAESPNRGIQDCLSLFLEPNEIEITEANERFVRDDSAVREIKGIFEKIAAGKNFKITDETFDKKTKLYILGLSPNAARISVRFFIQDSLEGFINKIGKHYQNMSIEKQFDNEPNSFSVWKLLNETVSPKSNDKSASPLLAGATMRAILQGTPYPEALYNAIIIRIRADHSINYYKASIIKAYLLRNRDNKKYKEVLTMSLNVQCDNKAYVLGRLFAVLEKAQEDASPETKLNSTIKDKYFTSACATPAGVFPVLLRLSNHHISKAEYGYVSENRIKEIMDILQVEDNPFPKNLSLEDQGVFILGYYHQKNTFYKKVDKEK